MKDYAKAMEEEEATKTCFSVMQLKCMDVLYIREGSDVLFVSLCLGNTQIHLCIFSKKPSIHLSWL